MPLLNAHPHLAAARLRTRSIALAQGPLLSQSRRHHRAVRRVHAAKAAAWFAIEVVAVAALLAALCRVFGG
jgi:hypothetical protein